MVTQSWFDGVAEASQHSERIAYTVGGKAETLLLTDRPYRVLGNEGLEGLLQSSRGLDGDDDKAARSPLRSLRGACERGRLSGEMAFKGLPQAVQSELGWKGGLWKKAGANGEAFYSTRALDISGIREIAHLGGKKP